MCTCEQSIVARNLERSYAFSDLKKMKKLTVEEYNQWLRNLPKHTVLGFQSCTDPKIRTIEESRENLRCLASSSMIVVMDSV